MNTQIEKVNSAILYGVKVDGKTYIEYAKITYNSENDKLFDIEPLYQDVKPQHIYTILQNYTKEDRILNMDISYDSNVDWLLTSYIYSNSNHLTGMKEV